MNTKPMVETLEIVKTENVDQSSELCITDTFDNVCNEITISTDI